MADSNLNSIADIAAGGAMGSGVLSRWWLQTRGNEGDS